MHLVLPKINEQYPLVLLKKAKISELIKLLSKYFNSQVRIVSGLKNRKKIIDTGN